MRPQAKICIQVLNPRTSGQEIITNLRFLLILFLEFNPGRLAR